MKIEKNSNGSGFVLTNEAGSLELSWGDFWEICRTGREIDTKSEVEEYLTQCPDINGHDLDRIRAFPALVDKITEQVIDDRINEETGDQIYYAAEKCINSHIAGIEDQVKWFRLSEDKCISVWYSPDKYDGDQFQMHLEEVGEDGYMGAGCEVLSDESYATADISFGALCETLSEICDDAEVDDYDMDDYYGNVQMLAREIYNSYGIECALNTKIDYLYCDASNWKVWNTQVLPGAITLTQKEMIYNSLDGGEFFIPGKVGLPEKRFEKWTDDDHIWFQLPEDAFSFTEAPVTMRITVEQLADSFAACKGCWEKDVLPSLDSVIGGAASTVAVKADDKNVDIERNDLSL